MASNQNNNPRQGMKIAGTGKSAPTPVTKPEVTAAAEENADDSVNLFGELYHQRKEENIANKEKQEIEKQLEADRLLASDTPIPVVSVNPAEEKKSDSGSEQKYKQIFIVFLVLTILIFVISAVYLVAGIIKSKGSVNEKGNTAPVVVDSYKFTDPIGCENTYPGITFPDGMQERFKAAYAQNSDFVGRLIVPGTCIDTPVYQTTNNDYYLKHDNYGEYTKYGIPYMDFYDDAKSLSRNTTIYGHNFDNTLIFDELHKYTTTSFYKESPVIEFDTLYNNYKWKIIACFRSNGDTTGDNDYLFYYVAASFGNNSFMDFYDELMQRSYIDTTACVDVQPTDKILTLSTCTYFFDKGGNLQNARLAVVARLVRDDESETVDTSGVKENSNVRYPQMYYDVFGGTNPYKNASKWVPSQE